MPVRILRVLAQTRARHLLESGPRQTLLSFPEGNGIMTNQEALAFFGVLVETANRECV